MLKIDSVAKLAKSMTTKSCKAGDSTITMCELKFKGCAMSRDAGDELLGMPIGWITATHYDELGSPLRPFTLGDKRREFQAGGSISGNPTEGRLSLVGATLGRVQIGLEDNQVLVSGTLTWEARGDEVEDVHALLGKTCKAELQFTWQEQERLPLTKGPEKFDKLMGRLKGGDAPAEGPQP